MPQHAETWKDKLVDTLGAAIVGILPDEWIKNQVKKKVLVEDSPYLQQYFGEQVLPDAQQRPKSLTKFQDRAFKALTPYNRKSMKGYQFRPPSPLSPSPQRIPADPYNTDFGLGRSTLSAAVDEQGKPYLSVFDSWDFDEKGSTRQSLDALYRAVLKRLGKPYNVYERLPVREVVNGVYEVY